MSDSWCKHGVHDEYRGTALQCKKCVEEEKQQKWASANPELAKIESAKREAARKKSLFAATVEEHILKVVIGAVVIFVVLIVSSVVNKSIRDEMPTQQSASPSNATVGTMHAVKPIQLNMRSGPGKQYSVVRVFKQNERIVSIGEPQNVNGELWIQATTPDGQIHGWVNRQMLYP